jgi:hypothetical protein
MTGGKSKNKVRSAPDTPEQNQEVDFEEEAGEETEVADQQDKQVFRLSVVGKYAFIVTHGANIILN